MNKRKKPFERTLEKGMKFGKLTVIDYNKNKKAWLCECNCGNQTYSRSWSLKTGRHKSCSCGQKESRKKMPNNLAIVREILRKYKSSAKRRGYIFEISEPMFIDMIKQNCFYCDVEPSTVRLYQSYDYGDRTLTYNGIDRVDNSKGYISGNIVTCCQKCNMAKREMTANEFQEWVKKVYNKMFNDQSKDVGSSEPKQGVS